MSGNRIFGRLAAPILTLAFLFVATPVAAQDDAGVLDLSTGGQTVIETPATVVRVAIADPSVIDVLPVTGRELVINGKASGTTSLLIWDAAGTRSAFNVRVSPDASNLQADLRRLFPGEDVSVVNNGRTVVLTGNASNSGVSSRIARMARASLGDSSLVVNELELPQPGQILLKVRFAEVSRSALERAGVNLLYRSPDGVFGSSTGRPAPFSGNLDGTLSTLSDAVNLFAFSPDLNLTAFIAALESNGVFRSLAEPNLLASHGVEASFLAGGEFPYPVLQGTGGGSVSIVFKEFGIKLDFTPYIQPGGNIRLVVAPEVSSLDFANGLTISGFNIPSILTRRASTEIELAEGQTFAIAGLIDNNMVTDYDKVPVLGDIPILGSLFRSKEIRQNRSELLVLVTPYLVLPENEMPAIPGGEADTWNWERHLEGDVPLPEEEGRIRELENRERGEPGPETPDEGDAEQGDAEADEPLTNE